jgi:dTDP-4-dehydrorhamnose 3,5-epimerase
MSMWRTAGTKGAPTRAPAWRIVPSSDIAGAVSYELRSLALGNGRLSELVRPEWGDSQVAHIFYRTYDPGTVSAWHAHAHGTDRLCCLAGEILLVLYDGRTGSPTRGGVAEYRIGVQSPWLVIVPPGVWHGFQNDGTQPAMLLNMSSVAYDHADPDHWTWPVDCPEVPYRFKRPA